MKRIVKLNEHQLKNLISNLISESDYLSIEGEEYFDNWVLPSLDQLKLEYKVEHELKNNHFFDSEEDFIKACEDGEIVEITDEMDRKITYRSRTKSQKDLFDLISGYTSFPIYRNAKTLQAIYDGFKNNSPMATPIVIEFSNLRKRVFSGNTRMDVAFQLGILPKVLMIKSKYQYQY
jgi:hypothetical protein